jgi:phosphate transport system protein
MTKHFQRDMDRLQREILSLAASVEEAISTAIKSLQHRDVELAEEVINGDQPIDLLENRIEEECLKVVALHQPVAIDLRQVAVDIAERTVVLAKLPPVPIPDRLGRMTDLTTQMVRQGLDAFVNMDTQLARQVIRTDDEVDRLNQEIIDELVLMMRKNADRIEPGLSLFSATRHLERIADHATNIAEDVIYLVEGEIIRHHPEAVENT